MTNIVFIATSLDGYIADKNGSLEWLHSVPNPDNIDTGFFALMERVDALIMGRNTLEVVLSFGCDWPYSKPVFVLSNTLTTVPEELEDKVFLVNGALPDVLADLNAKGFHQFYIDGGITIQNFLKLDLIDEMVITQFPILLGGGASLSGELDAPLYFEVAKSDVVLGNLVQTHYQRIRSL
ncbi:dihydrofolate reductase [Vibrio sp. SM6]|uniref:Dihydrofolate reductase n=1 Tax=Vibrio agarilyticus TaxID=2726741 RepID=A0A7X8YG63_9VIBR|nr:dihydrofolate reductase family protein [Vibrio agarilyticus]NLS12354.1 dihydrofolate reductase [Vibrio agarilyticus]